MRIVEKQIRLYVDPKGRCPFERWIDGIKDLKTQATIRVRLARVRLGNFGNSRSVGAGVQELKIPIGPGFRVYFGQEGSELVILLCGGNKATQSDDIKIAQTYWADYKRRRGDAIKSE